MFQNSTVQSIRFERSWTLSGVSIRRNRNKHKSLVFTLYQKREILSIFVFWTTKLKLRMYAFQQYIIFIKETSSIHFIQIKMPILIQIIMVDIYGSKTKASYLELCLILNPNARWQWVTNLDAVMSQICWMINQNFSTEDYTCAFSSYKSNNIV